MTYRIDAKKGKQVLIHSIELDDQEGLVGMISTDFILDSIEQSFGIRCDTWDITIKEIKTEEDETQLRKDMIFI